MLADDVAMADELSDSAVNDETGYGVFNLWPPQHCCCFEACYLCFASENADIC